MRGQSGVSWSPGEDVVLIEIKPEETTNLRTVFLFASLHRQPLPPLAELTKVRVT